MNEQISSFDFLPEVQKSVNFNALFPEERAVRAILWLYARTKTGAFPKGKFREQDIYTALHETSRDGFQRTPTESFNATIGGLQHYFLRYDDEEQIYTLRDYAKNVCKNAEDALSGSFNPTQIEVICSELKEELLLCGNDVQLSNWLHLNFEAFEPRMNGQVDSLDRHIDTAVGEIRATAQLQEGNVLKTLKEIDGQLERIRSFNEELRAAFASMKEINAILDIRMMNVDNNPSLLKKLSQTRQFFPHIRYRLDLIDKRLDRLQPRLRQFFAALNKPLFNTKVEKFLRFILKSSEIETVDGRKLITLPTNIKIFKVFQPTPHFTIVERRDELLPAIARKRKQYDVPPETVRKVYEGLNQKIVLQDKIEHWTQQIINDCKRESNVNFSTYFFKIVDIQQGDIELATKVAYRLLKEAAYGSVIKMDVDKDKVITNNNISIWAMRIQCK